jgi:hypothetical protein
MAKTHGAGEKTKETHVAGAKPAEAKGHEAKAGETKKPEGGKPEAKGHSEPKASSGPRSKGHTALPGHCFSWECKAEADRFNFCNEHYEHFKFGLIKKTGEPVPDYEKKIGHYQAHKAKKGAQKVA